MSEEDDEPLVTKPFKFVTERNTVGKTMSIITNAYLPKAKTSNPVVSISFPLSKCLV
ncbi:MAG: hypothetical protein Q9194_000474 [Teloschistes cf. exilis]